jgi:hypothetical protein
LYLCFPPGMPYAMVGDFQYSFVIKKKNSGS